MGSDTWELIGHFALALFAGRARFGGNHMVGARAILARLAHLNSATQRCAPTLNLNFVYNMEIVHGRRGYPTTQLCERFECMHCRCGQSEAPSPTAMIFRQ